MKKAIFFAVVLIGTLLSGCAAVPMATPEADQTAKQFTVDPGKANIYLYRNETFGAAIAMPVSLDGRVAGKTASKTYFYWSVEPGEHEIASLTENTAKINLAAEAGQNYYIWQEVKMGMWSARSQLHKVSEEEGQKAVRECKLIKSDSKLH